MRIFQSKKAFLDDLVDVGWTVIFVAAIGLFVYGFSSSVSATVKDFIVDKTTDINRDIVLLNYLRSPMTTDSRIQPVIPEKTQPTIDWINEMIVLNPPDMAGYCTALLGPETNKIFTEIGGETGFRVIIKLGDATICRMEQGAVLPGVIRASLVELPSIYPDRKLTISLLTGVRG